MSRILHLAATSDLERLERMVAAYHADEGIESDSAHRQAALRPLLEGSPHGAVWLIGPRMSPVGYVAVSFGWSIGMGGMVGCVDELWLREAVRGRGMGSEALSALLQTLENAGVMTMHLQVTNKTRAARIFQRLGFRHRGIELMTRLSDAIDG